MAKVFFTYVWGPPGDPAWPLTFATKASRAHARQVLAEGDLVYIVGTKGEPTEPEHYGRVLGVYRVSKLEVNTKDYDLSGRPEGPDPDGVLRFPYALHPIAVWEITSQDNSFAKLIGPLTPSHHLQAQSRVVELSEEGASQLETLARRAVTPALPKTEFGKGRIALKNSRLAPKHEGSFSGTFREHGIWYVYTLVLRDAREKVLAVKIGYSNDPIGREAAHNAPIASEVTGLSWRVDLQQPTASEDAARQVEQAVLARYSTNRLSSNGEIVSGVDPMLVAAEVAKQLRALSLG